MGLEAEQTKTEVADAQTTQTASPETKEVKPETIKPVQESSDDDGELSGWEPAKVKDYVKKLRTENKSYRQRAKGLEERLGKIETGLKTVFGETPEKVDPETQIQELTKINQAKDMRLTVLETAMQHGISGKEAIDYFEFLMSKKAKGNQELGEDDLKEIVSKVQSIHGDGPKLTKTTITAEKPATEPQPAVDLNQFMKMSVMEKSELYRTNEALYNKLMKDARSGKLFV